MSKPKRARRCQLSVPGSSDKMMAKAAGLTIDHVFLDLEDAVAPSAKPGARGQIVNAINSHDWRAGTLCVRINDVETEWCHDDIIEVVTGAGARLDTIMLTKAKRAADVIFVETLLDQLEKKLKLPRRIGIECLIEEVEGMLHVHEIAACSSRLECLIFGMGDYSASQQIQVGNIGEGGPYPGGHLALSPVPDDHRLPFPRGRSGGRPVCQLQKSRRLSTRGRAGARPGYGREVGPFTRARSSLPMPCSRLTPTRWPPRASRRPPTNRHSPKVWVR